MVDPTAEGEGELPTPGDGRQLDLVSSEMAGRVGLNNLGNTCFMNTGLQCLSHVEPFAAYFLSGQYKNCINKTNTLGCGGELAHTVAELQRLLWQSQEVSYDPSTFRETLERFAPHLFEGQMQQDAQEFLSFCLDGLHEDLNGIMKRPPPVTEEQDQEYERLLAERGEEFGAAFAWLRHLEYNKSFLVDLLQGQLRSTLVCGKCKTKSRRFDPFLYLSLPVAKAMSKVTDALKKFLEEEKLSGTEQWYCPKCKCNVNTRKKIDLWKLPPVLILHLKRFKFEGNHCEKIDVPLTSPLVVDMKDYCSSPQKEGATYEVICVANHVGLYSGGHYTATCRVGQDEWFHFNDEHVQRLSDTGRDVVSKEAYVLFLQRVQEPRSPKTPKSGQKQLLPVSQTITMPEHWPHNLSEQNSVGFMKWASVAAPKNSTARAVELCALTLAYSHLI
jgi:ubiquitin carboxyl-terminal hydrolase 8